MWVLLPASPSFQGGADGGGGFDRAFVDHVGCGAGAAFPVSVSSCTGAAATTARAARLNRRRALSTWVSSRAKPSRLSTRKTSSMRQRRR